MESPEPVRRFKKNEGETSSLVEFWTCSRVEVRQYWLVLILSACFPSSLTVDLTYVSFREHATLMTPS
jgi:hypothetical protein